MKTRTSLAIFVSMVAVQGFAQVLTADQIIEKSIAASGGRAAFAKQKSSVMKAEIVIGASGMKGEVVTYQKGKKMLVVTSIPSIGDQYQGFDGTIAWAKDSMNGLRKLSGEEKDAFIRSTSNSLLDTKTFYKSVELLPNEKLNDRDCYVLKFTPKTGEPITQYFDAQTFLSSRIKFVQKSAGQTMPMDIILSNYKDVEGTKVAHKMTMKMDVIEVEIAVTSIKINVYIPDSKFAYPATPVKPTTTKPKTK